jgi:CRP-like cAMP-binding protein
VARGAKTKTDMIRAVPLFAKLPKSRLNDVAAIADEISLPAGKQLTREGDRGREFLIVLEGSAEVRKNGRRVNTLGPGDFFGEISLITKVPRTATVTTSEPTRALVITDRAFAALLRDSPEITRSVLEALGERLATDLS